MDDFSAGGINLLPFAAIVSTEYNTHGNLYSTVAIKPFEPSYLEKPAIPRVNSIYRQPLFLRLLDAVNKEMELKWSSALCELLIHIFVSSLCWWEELRAEKEKLQEEGCVSIFLDFCFLLQI